MMEQVLEANPGHPEARYYLGLAYRQLGRLEDARRQLQIHAERMEARQDVSIEKRLGED
jgi:cytochrome c-type biogenesis protein CcmH/NrfG